ncbi:MAG: translation initiation factor [Bacteroidales bacterium]|nr:translation initiation factor [Bacteroidales bacterium]
MEDWKDKLGALLNVVPAAEENSGDNDNAVETEKTRRKETLHIVMEKKGRGGKTATIIEGFTCSDAELKDVAKKLQKSLGTGGSSRGGEILLQGDCRLQAAQLLRGEGYTVKGI